MLFSKYEKLPITKFFNGGGVSPCAQVINRELAISIGGWSLDEYPSHDYYFNARMAFFHSTYKVYREIAFYGVGINESLNVKTQAEFLIQRYQFIQTNSKIILKYKLPFVILNAKIGLRLWYKDVKDVFNLAELILDKDILNFLEIKVSYLEKLFYKFSSRLSQITILFRVKKIK